MLKRSPAALRACVLGKVEIEEVLPGSSLDRPRLDLRQVDISECEDAQSAKQNPGSVRQRENYGRLSRKVACLGGRAARTPESQEAREVAGIILDILCKDRHIVNLRRPP